MPALSFPIGTRTNGHYLSAINSLSRFAATVLGLGLLGEVAMSDEKRRGEHWV
jgi:hypothetical protein